MSIPTFAGPLSAAPDADWLEFVDCYAADDVTPRDFTGSDAEIALYRPAGGDAVARLSTQAGTCELTWAVVNGPLCRVQARWPAAAVQAAGVSGLYVAEVRVFGADGSIECVALLKQVTFGLAGGGRSGFGVRATAGGGVALTSGGPTGRPGIQGPAGGLTLSRTPSVVLSGHRVVKAVGDSDAAYPDLTATADAELLLGITTSASGAGAAATIQGAGELVEPSWSWTPGLPVFCGPAGVLTQTPNLTGAAWLRVVATATAPDRLLVQLRPPILL